MQSLRLLGPKAQLAGHSSNCTHYLSSVSVLESSDWITHAYNQKSQFYNDYSLFIAKGSFVSHFISSVSVLASSDWATHAYNQKSQF